MNEPLYYLRLLVVSLGAFTIGFALFIGWLYALGKFHSEVYGRGRHVAFIIISYVLLAGELIAEISYRSVHDEPVTWRLGVALVAFSTGVWALVQLMVAAKEREYRSSLKPPEGGEAT